MGPSAWGQRHNDTEIESGSQRFEMFASGIRLARTIPAVMQKLAACSLVFAALCVSLSAGPFHPQTLMQIPSQPGQQISSVQVDSQGNTIVAAIISQTGLFEVTSESGFVMKIDPQGNEIFSVALPALLIAQPSPPPLVLALDKNDDIYVGGAMQPPSSYPFTSILSSSGGFPGGFLIKLHGADGTMVYADELGGNPTSIVVDASGEPLLTLGSNVQLPLTPGAYSHGGAGGFSPPGLMYIVRVSQAGDSIVLSALYSGVVADCDTPTQCQDISASTYGSQVMQDAQGDIWIAGNTNTTDLPMTSNALKTTCGCSQFDGDGFLAEFSSDGTKLLYATYIGTSGADDLTSAAMDSAGNVWMAGNTNGSDLPVTSNAIQSQLSGAMDGFIAQYDPETNKLLYASYFGGTASDSITNVQIAAGGTVVIAGHSQSTALPIAASGFTRGSDFLATFDPQTYAGTFLTTFPISSVGTGLTAAPGGLEALSGTSNVVDFLVTSAVAAGTPSLYAVTNSANFIATGQVAEGELITLFGANIGPSTPVTADLSSGQPPTELGGVQVLVQNTPVPLLYVQQDQINAIMASAPAVSANAPNALVLTVNSNAAKSDAANLDLIVADPEAFSTDPPYAAALNQDGTVNSRTNPAAGGSTVAVFATGLGFGSFSLPPVADPEPGDVIANQVLVLCNGASLTITYAGQAPTLVAGVSQVTFVLPPLIGSGDYTLTLQFDVNAGLPGAPGWTGMPFEIWVK
jgi:uncharacterized protein (TIGR03437 family)